MLATLLLSLSACRPEPDVQAAPGFQRAVSLQHYFGDGLNLDPGELAASFATEQQAFVLSTTAVDHEAYKVGILAALDSANTADLYTYWAGARTAAISAQLQPLDALWEAEQLDQRFSPALVRAAGSADGHKYLLPITQHHVGFFYDWELFERLGLQPPQHWHELLALCDQLRTAGITPIVLGARHRWPAQFWFDYLLLRSAPLEFRERLMRGEARYTHPLVLSAFARWAALIEHDCFNTAPSPNELSWEQAAQQLFTGKAAMALMGSWALHGLRQTDSAALARLDFFPFPLIDPELPRIALGPVDGLVMPRQASNPDGARAVLQFFSRPEIQHRFDFGAAGDKPVDDGERPDHAPSDVLELLASRIRTEIAASPHFAFNYDLATSPAIAELGLNAFAELLEFPDAYRQIAENLQNEIDSLRIEAQQ